MTPNKITEADQKEMTRLAPIMAKFIGWEKYTPTDLVGNKWDYELWKISENTNHDIYSLVDELFDPHSENPNPRGFLPVLDRLEELYPKKQDLGIYFYPNHPKQGVTSCALSADSIRENPLDEDIDSGERPTRYIALYRAVEQLMEGEDDQ